MTLDSVRTLKKLRLWQITLPAKTTSDVTSDIPNWLVARQVYSPALSLFTFPMVRHPSCWKYGSEARAVPDRDHTTWPSASQQSFTVDPMAAKTWGGGFLVNIGDAALMRSAKEIMRILFLGFSVSRSDRSDRVSALSNDNLSQNNKWWREPTRTLSSRVSVTEILWEFAWSYICNEQRHN